MPTMQTTEITENHELSTHPVRTVAKRATLHGNAILEPMQQMDRLLGTENRWNRNKIKINNETRRWKQMNVSRLRSKL